MQYIVISKKKKIGDTDQILKHHRNYLYFDNDSFDNFSLDFL